jgi:foldase protein PrsA
VIVKIRQLSQVLLAPIVVLIVAGLLVTIFIGMPRRDQSPYIYKGPSVKINGVKVKDDDFNKVYMELVRLYGHRQTQESLMNQALEILINEELIKQILKERKIEADREEIKAFITRVQQVYPTEEELEMYLYQVGVQDLKALEDFYREILLRQTLYLQVAEERGIEVPEDKIRAAEDQLRQVYETIEFSHILIATDPELTGISRSDREALQKAEDIYERIMAGEDFAKLAAEHSDDESTAELGGRIEERTIAYFRQTLEQNFIETALQLAAGEVSRPVKTRYGYHIIRVENVKSAKGEEWEKEKETLRKGLLLDELDESGEMNNWVTAEREKADIKVLDPALRGYRFKQEEKWGEAALAYAKALKDKRYRRNLEVHLSAVEAYRQIGDYETALDVLAKTPEKIRREPDYALAKARVLHARGTVDEAKTTLAAAVEKAGEDISGLNYILMVAEELELTEEAEALKAKLDKIEEEREAERQELERLFMEEQKKLEEAAGEK